MTEIVFSAPDAAHVIALATALGYYDAKSKAVTAAGKVAAGGSYQIAWHNGDGALFLPTGETTKDRFGNAQPVMAAQPGIWGRLRHNADPLSLEALIAKIPANSGVTIYRLVTPQDGKTPAFWSSDGVTPAPDHVANIGVIA